MNRDAIEYNTNTNITNKSGESLFTSKVSTKEAVLSVIFLIASFFAFFIFFFNLTVNTINDTEKCAYASSYEVTIRGSSMYPTFKQGQKVALNYFTSDTDIDRFDIVAFSGAENGITEYAYMMKRVIGLPGDKLYYDQDAHVLYINDVPTDEPFVKCGYYFWENDVVVVPEGKVFVMGDSRNISYDSRDYGCINISSIYAWSDQY